MSGIKCFKCRNILTTPAETEILTAHGDAMTELHSGATTCASIIDKRLFYMKHEILPEWINTNIEESGWTKGKLHCSNCNSKIGSFDFVNGRKCICEGFIPPAVHFIRSQVDWDQKII